MNESSSIKIARLLTVEKKLREAESQVELEFIFVNELRSIVDYTFAFFLKPSQFRQVKVQTISDLSVIDRTAPTVKFIEDLFKVKGLVDQNETKEIDLNDQAILSNNLNRPENFPNHALIVPIHSKLAGFHGYLLLVTTEKLNDRDKEIISHVSNSFGHALNVFMPRGTFGSFIQNILSGWLKWLVIGIVVACMFIPMQMSALAPVEVVAKDAFIVTSPIQGVVEKVLVQTNDKVSKGENIIKLDDIDHKNRYEIALQELEVAEAELLRNKQSSFSNQADKAKLIELATQVKLKKKELDYAKDVLDYVLIQAEMSGVAIVEDNLDWQGRPVSLGEKIMTIAEPNKIEFLINLQTKDSIVIKKDAPVKIFLDYDPLNSISAKVNRISYKPELTVENILAYKVFASIDENLNEIPRIGLRGSAKIYGEEVSIFYYIFRVPLNITRQFIGF